MAKKKVFEVAKQFAVSPGVVLQMLKELGSEAASPMSVVELEMLKSIKDKFQAERDERRKATAKKRPAVKAPDKNVPKAAKEKAPKAAEEKAPKPTPKPEADIAIPAEAPVSIPPAPEPSAAADSGAAVVEAAPELQPAASSSTDDTTKPATAPDAAEGDVAASETESVTAPEPVADPEPVARPASPTASPATAEPAESPGGLEAAASAETAKPDGFKPLPPLFPALKARILHRPTVPIIPPGMSRPPAKRGGVGRGPAQSTENRATTVAGAVSRRAAKKRKRRQTRAPEVNQQAVRDSVRKTMAQMSGGAERRKKRRRGRDDMPDEMVEETIIIQMAEYSTVSELAAALQVGDNEIILKLMAMGTMATRNQRLDFDTIVMIADEFGVEVQPLSEIGEDRLQAEEDSPEDMQGRHPVVTVMGHVDHGKTSLLDKIRETNVVSGEKGGITQHVGAYEVLTERGRITFMDTPGHEAFTAMRLRGAQVTDVVILVVAADDGVMPQTAEAIDHARAAKVPIVIALNKCDLPAANPLRVKQMLTEHNLVVEDFGGSVQTVEVSAKSGQGIDRLLETILLESELLELKANPERRADGVVVEAFLDKGKGPVATVLVQQGTLKVGDAVIAGLHTGKVRAVLDENNKILEEVGPSSPARVLGLSGVPQAGDTFHVVKDEREAREIAAQRGAAKRTHELKRARVTLDTLFTQVQEQDVQNLPIIVKGDVDGSVEALSDSLERLSTNEVRVQVIRRGVGGITESDVMLAATSGAVILGFNVRPGDRARDVAQRERVDIRLYDVIYDAVSDVRMALEGLLAPEQFEEIDGDAEVRAIFRVPKIGTIAGCYVRSGIIRRNAQVRVYRDDIQIYESTVSSLKRFKDDAKDVAEGFECGIGVDRFNDLREGDRLETFSIREVARKL